MADTEVKSGGVNVTPINSVRDPRCRIGAVIYVAEKRHGGVVDTEAGVLRTEPARLVARVAITNVRIFPPLPDGDHSRAEGLWYDLPANDGDGPRSVEITGGQNNIVISEGGRLVGRSHHEMFVEVPAAD